jgi:hypothetical protein
MSQPKLDQLTLVVSGKSVALVGNAESLLEAQTNIDAHDIVVRMNRGFLVKNEVNTIGKRTDVLLTSGLMKAKDFDLFFAECPYVVWMSPKKRESLSDSQRRMLYFYPLNWWDDLCRELGHRPSTGCMGIDLFTRIVGTGEVHLYGFDFWRTPTSYSNRIRPGPHNPTAEEAFAKRRIPAAFHH